ncbi:MAG: hypothetical protein K1X72_03590 [Pyrinomonadaceae bacterium]|nr:hypothetical protein [Pyrinomonadaceae bacterium]
MENETKSTWKRKRLIFIGLMLLVPFIKSALIMFLWNAILPDLFHFPIINYWQSLGLFLLCKLLFGNFPFGKFAFRNKPFPKPPFREKFMNMTPDEKEKLRQQWKERCQK